MVTIAVLMTCHNRKAKTLQCLQSLFAQDDLNKTYSIKVFLVDDGSTDGTTKAVTTNFPMITLIKGNGELYWNRGMYTAWANATLVKPDCFLWLNDDSTLYTDGLKNMLSAAMLTNYEAIICGCIESPEKKGEMTYGGSRLSGYNAKPNYPNGQIDQCDLINGNCVLIPQFVFSKVGNLDWKFPHAIGDHDYGLRAKKMGILSYTTAFFVASCAKNEKLPMWCYSKFPLNERVRNLYSPLGYASPLYNFVYEKRHFGLLVAIKHFCSIHLRVLIPSLWK
jgi:GT2 family glycosyltransferase